MLRRNLITTRNVLLIAVSFAASNIGSPASIGKPSPNYEPEMKPPPMPSLPKSSSFVNSTQPPSDFPVPVFKGSATSYSYLAQPDPRLPQGMKVLTITSNDSVETLRQFYGGAMPGAGWQPVPQTRSTNLPFMPSAEKYRKNGLETEININGTSAQQKVPQRAVAQITISRQR